jgi:hypothetical protein
MQLHLSSKRRMISCALSSSIILTGASSFILVAPLVLSISPSLAAPAPMPKWLTNLVEDVAKNGALTATDIAQLKKAANGSYSTLQSLINRINALLAQSGSSYRLEAPLPVVSIGTKKLEASPGDTVTFIVTVVNQSSGKTANTYNLGTGTVSTP